MNKKIFSRHLFHLDEETHKEITSLCEIADEYLDRDEFELAIKKYQTALDLVPKPMTDWEASTWLLTAIGETYFFSEDFGNALIALKQVMARVVKEVDLKGHVRSWHETIDGETGKQRQIRVQFTESDGSQIKRHFLKEPKTGKLEKTWDSVWDKSKDEWVKRESEGN